MEEKDKIIVKDSALVVADAVAASVPGLNIAWGLCKGLYGAGIKLRETRALEWVMMIKDNPKMFYEELLRSQDFQDGFNYSFEKYIKERNEIKRKTIKNIFMGFATSKDLDNFQLEKFIDILSILGTDGMSKLSGFTFQPINSAEEEESWRRHYADLIGLGLVNLDTIQYADKNEELKVAFKKLIDPNTQDYLVSPRMANFELTDLGRSIVSFISK